MADIKTFQFHKDNFKDIKEYRFGKNWPVVYIAENGKEAYVGETISAYNRSRQHYENIERRKLKNLHLISDEEFNKSATLDIESWLIQYMVADGKFMLQNGNGGLKNHNYYDRAKYQGKFEELWKEMREVGLARNTLTDLKNSDLFKYSPYKTLTEDQLFVARQIFKDIKSGIAQSYIVHGKPGTGKTILATYLFKYLKEQEETKHLNMVLVIPMTSLRETIKKVFRKIKGLSGNMVVGPNEVARNKYDLIIVDEAHRLRQRRNITNYAVFDAINRQLGLPQGNEMDWILNASRYQIFFYDEGQSVRRSDVDAQNFTQLNAKHFTLSTQMRVEGGNEYIQFIEDIFDLKHPQKPDFKNYDFRIYDDIHQMFADIKEKDREQGLSRMVAGYAWPWHTKTGRQDYDIEIDGLKAVWNSTASDWVNSPNAVNEVGCIHTVQGYDLNYVGVIIGPEFGYDPDQKKFFVDKKKYFDRNGHAGITNPEELEQYVKNIYKTLLTRGIKGVFVYIFEKGLEKEFNSYFQALLKNNS